MRISIRKPIGYSHIGRKDQQEDAVWPLFEDVTADNHCIVLCDGVGGSEHGEIASQTTSRVIGEYLTKILKENHTVSEADVQEAVNLAYDELEKIDTGASEQGSVSMATTLTCICIHNNGILVAHMGDSRIYHISPRHGLLYQSADHSLVNALLQAGELTPEEAKNFPRKNVITKAIQPHGKRFKAEVQQLTDVQAGDYIFLCSDGVLEQLSNEYLVGILSAYCPDPDKLALLEMESKDKTRDNYTAYLIPIDKVEGVSSISHDDEISTITIEKVGKREDEHSASSNYTPVQNVQQQPVAKEKKGKIWDKIISVLALLCALQMIYRWMTPNESEQPNKKPQTEQLNQQYEYREDFPYPIPKDTTWKQKYKDKKAKTPGSTSIDSKQDHQKEQ